SWLFLDGVSTGYCHAQTAYRDRFLCDQDLADMFQRTCQDTIAPDSSNVGYLIGWLVALVGPALSARSSSPCPPARSQILLGQTVPHLTCGEGFRTGYQLGHLVARRQTRRSETSEVSIATLVCSPLASRATSAVYVAGVVAGWLITMSRFHLPPALLAAF